jgi:hypothetical protein
MAIFIGLNVVLGGGEGKVRRRRNTYGGNHAVLLKDFEQAK